MATFILVHGGNMSAETWNRLSGRNTYPPGGRLGAQCWDRTSAFLEQHGHRAIAPGLPDEHVHGLGDHTGLVCRLMEQLDLRGVILVGHSYGGMVITGAASRIPERVRRLVYIDAALPRPGESLFDLFSLSGLDPHSFAGLEAAKAYVEKAAFDPGRVTGMPKTYVRCTGSEFAGVTALAQRRISGDSVGWTYLELPTSHVPMASMPRRLNRILLDAANR